jgi:Fic-DOC domain mobile mystery protein B
MGLMLDYKTGQTPLDEEEKEGLKIKSIATREELNEFEQKNIEDALSWLIGQNIPLSLLLTEKFIKDLHFKMFGSVWLWAGEFRISDKTIGIDSRYIAVELKKLLDDCNYWIENKVFSDEEIAIRLKHRLVKIHPFPNGNGRHSRLMADTLMEKVFNKPIFSWGGISLNSLADERSSYIKALQEADKGNYGPLLEFAESKISLL